VQLPPVDTTLITVTAAGSSLASPAAEDGRWQLPLRLPRRPPYVLSRVAGVVKGSALQDEEGGGW
jgi:hypothetical protein